MNINKPAQAGSLNPSDVLVSVIPNPDGGIKVELETKPVVQKQFGQHIKNVILETVNKLGVENVQVIAQDKRALDYTSRARVQAAIERALL